MVNIHITQWVGKGYEERIGGDTFGKEEKEE